jgi:hypothetical protein
VTGRDVWKQARMTISPNPYVLGNSTSFSKAACSEWQEAVKSKMKMF